jgi:hypothetical protein
MVVADVHSNLRHRGVVIVLMLTLIYWLTDYWLINDDFGDDIPEIPQYSGPSPNLETL